MRNRQNENYLSVLFAYQYGEEKYTNNTILLANYVVNGIGMAFKGYLEGISDMVFSWIFLVVALILRYVIITSRKDFVIR